MGKLAGSRLLWFGVAVVGVTAAAVLLVPGGIAALFSPGYFMPHSHCYLNDRRMILLQGLSDFLIGTAYMGISATLGYLVYKARHDIPFEWMFLAFGLFIFSCGWTHYLEVWTLWHPAYWFSGGVKAITAATSVATALGFPLLIPRIMRLIQTARAAEERKRELESAHREMALLNRHLKDMDELKSQFFAMVSHELRTPLTIILGNCDRLIDNPEMPLEPKASVKTIQRNSYLLLKQVNDLLDASKLEAGKMEVRYSEADLAGFVRLVCSNFESLAYDRKIDFRVDTPPELPAQVDTEKLERVLVNLLSNAFKFSPEGGSIRCTLRRDATQLVLEVSDSGPGIPPEHREVIFERFRQLEGGTARRFGGTGLGLSIVRDFVALHHGTVEVDESPERGALFRVKLPLGAPAGTEMHQPTEPATRHSSPAVQELAKPTHVQAPPKPRTVQGTVLVVEDNPEMNDLIQATLHRSFDTISARDGMEGLAKARLGRPDLILTDIMMPGMSGDQFIRELRREKDFDQVPIVVLTARADDRVRLQALRDGATDYLVKPFAAEELLARAGNLVAGKKSREELHRAYQELEAFSYSLAHDLRAPLRAMRGFAGVLLEERGSALGVEGTEYVERIISAGNRLDRLIEDVLSYTRMARTPVEVSAVDLDQLVGGLLRERPELQAPKALIEVRRPLGTVVGDEASLTQCIMNLLGNAVKFVAPGTTPTVTIGSERVNGRVRIWFQDNGIGISKADQERIFGLFQRIHSTREYEGTGLGLSIVRKAVERMHGHIGVVSEPGQGSRFWIELPAIGQEHGEAG